MRKMIMNNIVDYRPYLENEYKVYVHVTVLIDEEGESAPFRH